MFLDKYSYVLTDHMVYRRVVGLIGLLCLILLFVGSSIATPELPPRVVPSYPDITDSVLSSISIFDRGWGSFFRPSNSNSKERRYCLISAIVDVDTVEKETGRVLSTVPHYLTYVVISDSSRDKLATNGTLKKAQYSPISSLCDPLSTSLLRDVCDKILLPEAIRTLSEGSEEFFVSTDIIEEVISKLKLAEKYDIDSKFFKVIYVSVTKAVESIRLRDDSDKSVEGALRYILIKKGYVVEREMTTPLIESCKEEYYKKLLKRLEVVKIGTSDTSISNDPELPSKEKDSERLKVMYAGAAKSDVLPYFLGLKDTSTSYQYSNTVSIPSY